MNLLFPSPHPLSLKWDEIEFCSHHLFTDPIRLKRLQFHEVFMILMFFILRDAPSILWTALWSVIWYVNRTHINMYVITYIHSYRVKVQWSLFHQTERGQNPPTAFTIVIALLSCLSTAISLSLPACIYQTRTLYVIFLHKDSIFLLILPATTSSNKFNWFLLQLHPGHHSNSPLCTNVPTNMINCVSSECVLL